MKQHVMIGIGEVLWDLLPQGRQLGGAPANFAYHASQLGNEGVVVSSIGRDGDGEAIIDHLNQKGVSHLITTTEEFPTGTVSVRMGSNGVPDYIIHNDVAWDYLSITEEHLKLAQGADVVCFGSLAQRNRISAQAITRFIDNTPESCIRICDINLRQDYYSFEIVEKLLNKSTVLKLNDEEIEVVAGMFGFSGEEDDILTAVSKRFTLDLLILTKGAEGSRLFSLKDGDSRLSGTRVQVRDTVGAGDSFTAAVATGLVRRMKLGDIHELAASVAAFVCSQEGATPELPPVSELLTVSG